MLFKLYDSLKKISGLLMAVSGVALGGSAIFTAVSIIMRYCLKMPILGSTEIMEVVMAVTIFAAIAYTQTEKGHIHVMMVMLILPEKLRLVLFALNSIITTICSGAVTYGMWAQGAYALRKNLVSALLYIPYYPFYYFAAICMAVFTLVLLVDTLMNIMAIFNKTYADHVQSFWG